MSRRFRLTPERSFLGLAALILVSEQAYASVVYTNDFEDPNAIGLEWSSQSTDITPSGRRFLGRFVNETVTLSLGGLPSHEGLRIGFDLFAINSWDGNASPGPDVWQLSLPGGAGLTTTFSNVDLQPDFVSPQAYPDPYPAGSHPPRTGASEVNTLGYPYAPFTGQYGDSVYHLTFAIQHSDMSATIDFGATGLQPFPDETWGLDNVTVEILDTMDAGAVPDGEMVPGTPLAVELTLAGALTLSWGASCATGDNDYEVYEGTVGLYYSHAPKFCSTAGARTITFPAPSIDAYYLVVPRNGLREGSYGRRSDSAERPRATPSCLPQQFATVCP